MGQSYSCGGRLMNCTDCGLKLYPGDKRIMETMVGYISPPDHDHNDNCLIQFYTCPNNHSIYLSVRRVCSNKECSWKGKKYCFCHKGPKLDAWPS